MKDFFQLLKSSHMKASLTLFFALALLLHAKQGLAQCSPDTEAPNTLCKSQLIVEPIFGGPTTFTVYASDFDNGSTDNCTATNQLKISIQLAPASDLPPSTEQMLFGPGQYQIVLWAVDEAGNASHCWSNLTVDPDCSNGGTQSLACNDNLAVDIPPSNSLELFPAFFLAGGAYCSDYGVRLGSGSFESSLQLDSADIGTYTYEVKDLTTGNSCWGTLTVGDDCQNDNTPPTVYCNNGISLTYVSGGVQLNAVDVNAGSYDNCPAPLQFFIEKGAASQTPPNTTSVVFDLNEIGANDVTLWATDAAGNSNFCTTSVMVDTCLGNSVMACNDQLTVEVPFQQPAYLYPDDMLEGGPYCLNQMVIGNQDFGVPQPFMTFTSNDLGTYTIQVLNFINGNSCWGTVQVVLACDTSQYSVAGTVFVDTLANCLYDPGEIGLENWKVKAVGQTTGYVYTTTSGANGVYQINGICSNDTEVELSLDVPFNYGQTCPTTWTVQTIPNMPAVQYIPVHLETECPLMVVDLATPFLRRCFLNTYTVSFGNYSSQAISDTWVEVELDSFMNLQGSSLPAIPLGSNRYKFETGSLGMGQTGSFNIEFELSCDAMLGQTHCTEAHIFPDTICPQGGNWSGANIAVEGNCEGDSVHLRIRNTGTGNMTAPLDFIVVEDVIMYMSGDFNLNAGELYEIPAIAAGGETWRLEAQQVPAHPYPGSVSVTLEGCNGLNMTGLVNLFPTDNPNPFIAVDCQENVGSFDPNDKSAVPTGYGNPHFINQNTDIEYLIRFQNTGTDTAFKVVILDTLSEFLDPTTIRPGASSHPFSFEILDEKLLRFNFSGIMLPDSNTNEAASHGFVQFVAKQKPDLAKNTVIENTAAIYFDLNAPVITNTVFHTISENFIEVSDASEANGLAPLHVFPNPASEAVTFMLPIVLGENASFQLHDQLGKLVRNQSFSGDQFRLERKGMASGIYFYSIENEGVKLYSGKVILR
jgi:hypothetical protein